MYEANAVEVLASLEIEGVVHKLSLDEEDIAHLVNKGEYDPIEEIPLPERLAEDIPDGPFGVIEEVKDIP